MRSRSRLWAETHEKRTRNALETHMKRARFTVEVRALRTVRIEVAPKTESVVRA